MSSIRTPLRYPGGKQKIAPFLEELIKCNNLQGCTYIEPYAGGAGVALELLISGIVKKIQLNDYSLPVYSFWKTVITEPDWLCREISYIDLSIDEWKKQREVLRHPDDHLLRDLGLATFYLNRCNRSGILSGGVIGGLNQTGEWKIDARFPREELISRIEIIANYKDKISITKKDAKDLLETMRDSKALSPKLIYCDPPYVRKAESLYLNHYTAKDHESISNVIQSMENHFWLVSYDNAEIIAALYNERRKFTYDLRYNARTSYVGKEIMIFSDNLAIPFTSKIKSINQALIESSQLFA